MSVTNVKVLYIGGTGRTGSTTLDQILGTIPGWFSAGELAFLWRRGILRRAQCSCGRPILDCKVWSTVLSTFDGDVDALARSMIESRNHFWSIHMPLMAVPGFARSRMRSMGDYLETLQRLYAAMAHGLGFDVIVDSSKEPHYSWLLREGTDLDVSFVMLVRDPRATGNSWRRRKAERGLRGGEFMETRNSFTSSLYYMVSNIGSEVLWWRHRSRFRFLRYEDLVLDPVGCLRRIGAYVDPEVELEFVDGRTSFELGALHTSWGNPDRVGRSRLELRPDERWRSELPLRSRIALTLYNLPLILRYGYPIRPSGRITAPRSRRLRAADLGRDRSE